MNTLPKTLLVEADLFFSYLTGDALEPSFRRVVNEAQNGSVDLFTSAETYDDVITAFRSQRVPPESIIEFVADMKKIPHRPVPVTPDIAAEALRLYRRHGRRGRLHYFDSYHVATAKVYGVALLTSDRYVIRTAREFGIEAIDARRI